MSGTSIIAQIFVPLTHNAYSQASEMMRSAAFPGHFSWIMDLSTLI